MRLSIGGYSFHRLFKAGKQDMFQYITDCKRLGATQLDPWNEQLESTDAEYVRRVREAADAAEMPFGCLACDGCHIYEDDPQAREANRQLAEQWLNVAQMLGAPQVRIDAGGPQEMPGEVFDIIVSGYKDLVDRARARDIEVLMENHWGPSLVPDNVVRILEAVDGLGLLFDSNNWDPELRQQGWETCAKYARSTHFKTFKFDENGNDPDLDNAHAIRLLVESGYSGCWGIESVPDDGDEYAAVEKTRDLIRRTLTELGVSD